MAFFGRLLGSGGAPPGGGDIPTTGLLAAYSVRRLHGGYTGALIRVRRSSDNSEQDIGYDGAGHLDTAALATFVGAGSGLVTMWYDQSGSAKHAINPTAAEQPLFTSAGTMGSRPGINFEDGSGIRRLILPADVGTAGTILTTARLRASAFNTTGRSSTSLYTFAIGLGASNQWSSPAWDTSYYNSVAVGAPAMVPAVLNVPIVYTFVDVGGLPLGSESVGGRPPPFTQRSWLGWISEVLLYGVGQSSSDRGAAEASAMAYYGIS